MKTFDFNGVCHFQATLVSCARVAKHQFEAFEQCLISTNPTKVQTFERKLKKLGCWGDAEDSSYKYFRKEYLKRQTRDVMERSYNI